MRSLAIFLAVFAGVGIACNRESARGETCARTDDCAQPLRCVQFVCKDPVPPGSGVSMHPGAKPH